MNILFISGRELSYPRNRLLYDLLARGNHVDFLGQRNGRASISCQSLLGGIQGLVRFHNNYPLYFVGFWGHFLMQFMRIIPKQRILFDAFISTYDTLCFDRQQFSPTSIIGKLAFYLDQKACLRAQRVLIDTQTQARYFQQVLGVPSEKLDVLFVGADSAFFHPLEILPQPGSILFYGSNQPLHGTSVILQTAERLQKVNADLHFRMIGPFDKDKALMETINKLDLRNVEFVPELPLRELPAEIARAEICLGGHFGSSAKAARVIAGKTFQCIAMGRPTIVGDNDANQELLTHGEDAWLCAMNDAGALADAILILHQNEKLRARLSINARQTFLKKASEDVLAEQLREIVMRTMEI